MAERKVQRPLRCENQYEQDRLSSQKLVQVYHWLVPDRAEKKAVDQIAIAQNEKANSHLRASVV